VVSNKSKNVQREFSKKSNKESKLTTFAIEAQTHKGECIFQIINELKIDYRRKAKG